MISVEQQNELRARFNPDGSNVRRAQLRMLQMLQFIDEICQKNNIAYWIDSGTLLGAARHGGYIPWDDDTDVCMPVNEYKKFKKIMLTQQNEADVVLQCDETDSGFLSPWDVLRDLKSEYIQDSPLHQRRKYRGVQVDIFPQSDDTIEIFRRFYQWLYRKSVMRVAAGNGWKSKLLRPFLPINYFVFKRILSPLTHLIAFRKNEYYRMPYGAEFKSIRYKKNIFPLKRMNFEGVMVNVPNNIDGYLRDIYGDWEKIPDVDHIQTHNVEVRFF